MKTTKIKKGEIFTLESKSYKIMHERLVPYSLKERISHAFGGEKVDYPLTEFGNMWYYQIGSKYVLFHKKRYPCFDAGDSQSENRYFLVFFLCHSFEEMQQKHDYLTSDRIFSISSNPGEQYRAQLCPYVYYTEDNYDDTFLVYEK